MQTDLLTFDFTRIAGHEAGLAQFALQRFVVFNQCACDAETDGAGLTGGATACRGHEHVELVGRLRQFQRLANNHARGFATEEVFDAAAIDGDFAVTLAQEHAGGGGLATAGAVVLLDSHDLRTSELQRLRLLGSMRVVRTCIHLELAVHRTAQRILRQHAFHAGFDDAFRMAIQRFAQAFGLQVTDVTGEAVIFLVFELVAGDRNLLSIDHDDIVAGVHLRGLDRLVLATEAVRDFDAEAAEGLAFGIYHVPILLHVVSFGGKSLHELTRVGIGTWSG